MQNLVPFSLALALLGWSTARGEKPAEPHKVDAEWGNVQLHPEAGWAQLSINAPQANLPLPTPLPNITRAFLGSPQWPGQLLQFSFNSEATEITLHLPPAVGDAPVQATLEISEQTQQMPDGRIVFSALDAVVKGQHAKLESHPGSHRIGFWADPADYVQWNYAATRPGRYEVQVTYSVAGEVGEDASEIEIAIGDNVLAGQLASTGSWYRYTTQSFGKVYLPAKAEYPVTVKCVQKIGGAVMNLKAVTLVPITEGKRPQQNDDGTILLHAKDVTVNGVLLQWEPREIKRTLGFWANPADSAYWDFDVAHAGDYQVEILQGCGAGQGGSQVQFDFYQHDDADPITTLPHTVKDTGHWQGFEPIAIGRVSLPTGQMRVRVLANSKQKAAVMDLRQIKLTPIP